ncbi:nuclear transport factor 2 family protein [Pseudomonas sp. UBA4617]|uniref:nuclear transport factor 2 family protein n=1 Tax=Pseudomonas sp. UBA4617 TaxID=1947318 RepID=UPI0025FA604F|nr:nuclear transport factor 2 family protein [Pseudomonas sp. UBA4617]
MSVYLQRFAERFACLQRDNLHILGELYDDSVTFRDPLHHIEGLDALRAYFGQLYANARDVSYSFAGYDEVRPGQGYLRWHLRFCHPRLNGGKPIILQGCSFLQWRERVFSHQDYFDAGALLYEHVPVLGGAVRWLKGRLA